MVIDEVKRKKIIMNKKEVGKIKAGFIMSGWLLSIIQLHKWGFGWILSLILGFIFVIALWLGVAWTIKNTFGK